MDLADIKRRAAAALQFQETVKGLGFTVQLPTEHEFSVEAARARAWLGGAVDPAAFVKLKRALLVRGVVAWSGVTLEHLFPGSGNDTAELVDGAAAVLFDADPEIEETLWACFLEERGKRNKKQEDAAKN